LITGGAGFIGSHLAEHLVRAGENVRVIDDFSTGKRDNISDVAASIELIEASILDSRALASACKGVDYVLHEAAIPSVPRSVKDPVGTHEAAATGTLMVLEAARAAKVKRVIYAASSSAYGDTPTLPKNEDMKPEPLSPYAIGKLTGEYYARVYYEIYGLETVSLRYFNVFGLRQDPESLYAAVIPIFIAGLLRGERPTIFGDGEQTRDFTYVDNVVDANLEACTAEGASGGLFNIASGTRTTINDLFRTVRKIVGANMEPIYGKPRAGDVKHSLADISRAKSVLGYEPKVALEEGLQRTVKWYKEHM
jgi:UDP-glucose 4-epimerase